MTATMWSIISLWVELALHDLVEGARMSASRVKFTASSCTG